MPSNVEIKARVGDVDKLVCNVLKFTDTPTGTDSLQEDTFFHVNRGRIKLRLFKVKKTVIYNIYSNLYLFIQVIFYIVNNLNSDMRPWIRKHVQI